MAGTFELNIPCPENDLDNENEELEQHNGSVRQSTSDGTTEQKDIRIEDGFKPVTILLYIFGLTFTLDKRRPIFSVFTVIYHILMHVIIGTTNILYFGVYSYGMAFGPVLALKFTIHAFYICLWLNLMSQTSTTLFWKKTEKAWLQYRRTYNIDCQIGLRIMKRCAMIFSVSCIIGTVLLSVYLIRERNVLEKSMSNKIYEPLLVYFRDSPGGYVMKTCYEIIVCVFFGISYTMPFNYMLLIYTGLFYELRHFNDDLSASVRTSDNIGTELELFRRRHLSLCGVLRKVDDIYSFFILFLILFAVFTFCLVLYALILSSTLLEFEVYKRVIYFCVPAFLPLFGMLLLTVAGTKIYEEACRAKMILYSIDIVSKHWKDAAGYVTYHSFLSHLVEGNFGLSGWKFFYISKLLLKMLSVLIVSYTTMLLKFGSNEDLQIIITFLTDISISELDLKVNVRNATSLRL